MPPARVHGVGQTYYVEPCFRMLAVEVFDEFHETAFAVSPGRVSGIDLPKRLTHSHRANPRHPCAGGIRTPKRKETHKQTHNDHDDSASHAMALAQRVVTALTIVRTL